MPPTDRFVCRFAAEPPQDPEPYGDWEQSLRERFLAACADARAQADEDPGEPGDVAWYPDRTWNGRTYVPATALTATGWEYFGFVSYAPGDEERPPGDLSAVAELTDDTAERNPDWRFDVNDEQIGAWRGELGRRARMVLFWGRALVPGGAVVTAELADLAVDQAELRDGRFTLIAPDDYRGDFVEFKLWSSRGELLARESLDGSDDEDDEDGAD